MFYRTIVAAIVSAMLQTATCLAQSYTTFAVIPSSNSINSSAGWTPLNIYAVDVNNDGIPDLIQDNGSQSASGFTSPTGQFGVSISNGDGTFRPAIGYDYPPGVLSSPMAFGDFNGDGKMDIATSTGGTTVAIYLGRGDGSFLNPWYSVVPLAAGQTVAGTRFLAADFNHDGKLDLAIVGSDSNSTTVYLLPGRGNGLFSEALPVFTSPSAIGFHSSVQNMMIGDFDSDGNVDIAFTSITGTRTGNAGNTTIHVLYGAGNLSFDDTAPFNNGFGQIQVVAGDLNSDGYTDLFAIDSNTYHIYSFYGQAGRTFATYSQSTTPIYYDQAQDQPTLAMADFNGDGSTDLILTSTTAGKIYMVFFLSTGDPGQFIIQTWDIGTYQSVSTDTPPVVGDFNHDGKPDFAFVHYYGYTNPTIYTGLNGTSGGLWSDCAYPRVASGISLCSPASSSTPIVNFNAAAQSFGPLRKMEVWVDGEKLTEQHHTWGSYASLNFSSTLAEGRHQGTIYAADVDGTLKRLNFNFTVGPPTCSVPSSVGVYVCEPTNSSSTSLTPVIIAASANITGTLARMEIWVDGVKQYTETNSTSLSTSIDMLPGTHQITVVAVNTEGILWEQTVTTKTRTPGPSAWVYVSSLIANTSNSDVYAFSADSTGQLAAISGSPFPANVRNMAVNGLHLFGTELTGSHIDSYNIESTGALTYAASIDTSAPNNCRTGPLALFLDHTGASLYDLYYWGDQYCANSVYQAWDVGGSAAQLTYIDATTGSQEFTGTLSFIGNDLYGYTADCYHFAGQISGFKRNSNGSLVQLPINPVWPTPPPGQAYCAYLTAADPTNHLATPVQPYSGYGSPAGPYQLASYTVQGDGSLTTTSTYSNMPQVSVGSITNISMSPSGKLLAVSGTSGLQVFYFNGANPILPYTGLLTTSQVDQMFWDNDNHLYAIGTNADKLWVFTVTPMSYSQTAMYSINQPVGIIVQPLPLPWQ